MKIIESKSGHEHSSSSASASRWALETTLRWYMVIVLWWYASAISPAGHGSLSTWNDWKLELILKSRFSALFYAPVCYLLLSSACCHKSLFRAHARCWSYPGRRWCWSCLLRQADWDLGIGGRCLIFSSFLPSFAVHRHRQYTWSSIVHRNRTWRTWRHDVHERGQLTGRWRRYDVTMTVMMMMMTWWRWCCCCWMAVGVMCVWCVMWW